MAACDLAEVLGSAVALNLLFHIPLLWAVIITGLDVLLLLGLQGFGMRTIEAVVLLLVATIAVCYFIEIFVLPQTRPSFPELAGGMVPQFHHVGMVYVAIGIIGATVMPHNLYLHSALVQSRRLQKDERSMRRAIRVQHHRFDGGADASPSSSTRPSWCWRPWSSSAKKA